MRKNYYIGLDIGGTKLAAAVVNSEGRILGRSKTPTPDKPRAIISAIQEIFFDALDEADVAPKELCAIGVGVPGLVNPTGTEILRTPNTHLSRIPLVTEIRKIFKTPVLLGNDVNVGLLGEQWLGAGKNYRHILGIFPGTGVGGAIIRDGKLVTGANGLAAEIGHMIVEPGGPLCGCGNHGCLEALTGRRAIEREIRQAVAQGHRTIVSKLTGGKLKTIKSKILKKALRAHDPLVSRIMKKSAQTLGQACVSLRHILDPDLIILGGGVMEACGDFILPIVQQTVQKDPFFARVSHCRIVTAKLGDDAVILGAVALVRAAFPDIKRRGTVKVPRK